jgi:hypothetical protein
MAPKINLDFYFLQMWSPASKLTACCLTPVDGVEMIGTSRASFPFKYFRTDSGLKTVSWTTTPAKLT